MAPEFIEIGLLALGWIVSFLLGKELQTGFVQWRERAAQDAPPKRGPRP